MLNPGLNTSSSAIDVITNPLGGVSTNGQKILTVANTWYAVPSTVPTSPYVLVVVIETGVGTIRWGFDNSGTPSSTNGVKAPDNLIINLEANQTVYFSSSSAGDIINWTTKVI